MSKPKCVFCGRRPAKVFVRRGYFHDGSDFVGHRSCWLEMTNPEHERLGHLRHDIKEGGRR